jgi:integrase
MTPRRFTHNSNGILTVRFYLNHPRSRKETSILISVHHPSFRLKVSTGELIAPNDWNPNSQRPRKSYVNHFELTGYLDYIEQSIKALNIKAKMEAQELTPEAIRTLFRSSTHKESETTVQGFYESYREYLEVKQGKLSKGFLYKMGTLMKLIQDFEKCYSYTITFESIDLNFYERFTSYLTNDRNQLDSTSNKYLALLKGFMNWSFKLKKHTNLTYKDSDFKSTPVESELIALTLDELMSLYRLELVQGSRLYKVRELFCFQCFTGLRFSEVVSLDEGNVRGDELYFREHKTKSLRVKALNQPAMEILRRNGFSFQGISNQKLNKYLKELGQLAGITAPVQVVKYRGSQRIELVKPKFEFITTHVARASFITISLQLNVPAEVVKRDTGHASDASFRRYVRFADSYSNTVIRNAWSHRSLLQEVG